MSKTVKEIAEEIGVSKTAIRNKMTEEFRSKYVQTSTENQPQTLLITEEGVNLLKSMFQGGNQTANLSANQAQTQVVGIEFYERQIESLQKLLDQSQQLLLNEQKKNQLLLETKTELADWKKEKTELEKEVSTYRNSLSEANRRASNNYNYAENVERLLWIAGIIAGIFFVIILVLIWIHFF
ncbi:hypothetical protein GE022_010490 (plasmid) [Streptococcus canis]|uniref:hypothetical protein n=1 Tax=Streptococcus canis TaxID=1329 RepID=UPI0013D9375B|nr:hypothetical protein [Streptococcus canis]QKG76689.1 hypothetical protein GE022_010490 [Streptococcus canis]